MMSTAAPHHQHQHHHHHHQHGIKASSGLAFVIAIVMNLTYTVIQVVYSLSAHSTSLLADAGHNFSDVLSLILAGIAFILLHKKGSRDYSYGLKKSTILASLSNALWLIVISALLLIQAINHLIHATPVDPLPVIVVAGVGIIVNGLSALLFMRERHDDLNIKSAFLHLAYDAMISLGVLITAVIIHFTHWYLADPIIGIIIVLIILRGSIRLLKESWMLSMDAVPTNIDFQEVFDYLIALPGVTAVHDLHIWALSTQDTALTAHLVMPNQPMTDIERKAIEQHLHEQFKINHSTIQIEQQGEHCGNC